MEAKHIERDYSKHRKSIIRPYDEYIKFECFSFDPKLTRTYLREDNTLKASKNCKATSLKSWSCYISNDEVNDMVFDVRYNAVENGDYRIDVLYEQSNHIYTNTKHNINKDMVGNVTITRGDDEVYNRDVLFDGENNVIKRRCGFTHLNKGNHNIKVSIPANCYALGIIVRKIITYVGDNYYGNALGSEDGNMTLLKASYSLSDMTKPSEVQVEIAYDEIFECDESPSGFYIDYMDECNLYLKDDENNIVRIFGGYISSILPDSDMTKLTLHCADRLNDGETKYVLDHIALGGGTTSQKTDDYTDGMTKNFSSYPATLKYLCELYENSLQTNISKDYTVDGEKFNNGLTISFGKKKTVKSIPTTNGYSTAYNNYILLRNKSTSDKKQVWTLYDAKKHTKLPPNITDKGFLHITYGLGNTKTSYKTKITSKVDTADTTAGSQKFGKCGVSQDKKYVMSIAQPSAGKGNYNYHTLYKTIFKNKCPQCGKEGVLRWDSARSGTNCITCGGYSGSKRTWGDISETEVSCNSCCSDFCGVTGWEKDGAFSSRLTTVAQPVKSSKAEQNKLYAGNMVAVPSKNVSVSADDIFKAITKIAFKYKYKQGTSSSYSSMKKTGSGDCWAFSDLIYTELKKYGISCKIVQYGTGYSDNHRSVLYLNAQNKWVDFPYREYGWNTRYNNMLNNTSGSKRGSLIAQNNGSNIGGVKVTKNTTKSQTTEITHTKGYDKDKPFQGYLKITYSLQQSFTARKYTVDVKFTYNSTATNSINTGLPVYWVNNTIKQSTLKLDDNKNLVDFLQTIHGENASIYLQSIHMITPIVKATKDNKDVDWYKVDNSTDDQSSCKLNLYQIKFDNNSSVEPSELGSCGKTVNSMIKKVVEDAGYYMNMTYGLHRSDDKINFRVANQTYESYTASEGDNNNILSWNSISYSPVGSLYNMSTYIFKKGTLYYFIESKDSKSILNYGEKCTLATSNEPITENEAYFNAMMSSKFSPSQTYTYTITVPNYPNLRIGDLVKVVANAKKLNSVKEVKSIKIEFDEAKIPRIQTTIGLDELDPDSQLKKNIRKLRENAKNETTDFSSSAIPVSDEIYYEWDK